MHPNVMVVWWYFRLAVLPQTFISFLQSKDYCMKLYKKLSYRRVTSRCVLPVVILPITTQQCRNYLYDKS